MTATFTLLTAGYDSFDERNAGRDGREKPWHVASTVALLRDGDTNVVVDPGMVADRKDILAPLADAGLSPEQVTDVVFSHHHPDHTLNAALFPHARAHDVWAFYENDLWHDRPADGFQLSPSIRLMETPGHTPQDISTVAETDEGTIVLTHVWWTVNGPADDPTSNDREGLRASRRKILDLKPALIVPGHGAPFVPSKNTPV
ncbi:MBL fold metallo-hydrolase [Streptomyces ochraceiscleroticus]|uniref:Metallo-beta-lactamase domain-containing protein 1 n=1 Tax=Streptomyces ochraceiscleroticus TaxID=47761 RepID=A0ABW1MGZ6_9ACTN|nr:MBL fold metallo-hydrolase [Streptomyces ochraceiscleroticus]